ncbi:MAG: hypothetical protein E3J72_00560 [Planctomycetota bacterium]|nr:MAG: hypothetical protein E3J72_00560 [Planctomycetota bacterium]
MRRKISLVPVAVCVLALTVVSTVGCSRKKKNLFFPPATGSGTSTGTGTNTLNLEAGEVAFAQSASGPYGGTMVSLNIFDNLACTYRRDFFPNPSGDPPDVGTVTAQEYGDVINLINTADFFSLDPSYSSSGGNGESQASCTVSYFDGVRAHKVTAALSGEPEAPQALLDLVDYLNTILNAKLDP